MDGLIHSTFWQQLFVLPGNQIEVWASVVRALFRVVIALLLLLAIPVPPLILWERRFLGFLQGRLGPNRVGPFGLLQPIADVTKLLFKEDITPTNVDKTLYFLAPAVALAPVIMAMTVLPWNSSPEWGAVAPGLNIGILFLLGIASIEVYGVILAGWSSNNKYSLLGGLRASSQVISYELAMGLAIIAILLTAGTLDTQKLVFAQGMFTETTIAGSTLPFKEHNALSGFWNWHVFSFFPFGLIACVLYMIAMIAETNRAPFDLPEAETELVAGFHTEYTSMKFAMFFMGEYTNMVVVSSIAITLFFGGWLAPFGFLSQVPPSWGGVLPAGFINFMNYAVIPIFWFASKLFVLLSFFILVRASYPRLRYDMLMNLGWRAMLPIALVNLILIALSMALQQIFGIVGHLIAVAVGIAFCAFLFGLAYLNHQSRRKSEADHTSTEFAPVRRPTTATPTPALSAPE